MEKKIEDLTNLNYRLISFIETILSREEHCIKHGEHIYLKQLFQNEFNDILNKNQNGGDQKLTITRQITREPVELYIPIPESDIQPIEDNSEQFLKEMIGGDEKKEIIIEGDQIESDTEDLFEYLKQELPKEQQGGKLKSILKKKVQLSTINDRILSDTDNESMKNREKIHKKAETKKQKINRKLNKLGAEDVKRVGKEFNIKPEKGKRYLTKKHIIDKVSKNTKIYNKVLDHVNENYKDIVKTDTENSIS